MKLRAVLFICALAISGCASITSFFSSDNEVAFSPDPETNMLRADTAMKEKNYNEAAALYEYVKTKFPYVEAATSAELGSADADFEREKYIEARDRYQTFVRLHPTHPRNDYAAYRAALSHYKEIPSDFFLLPPASEKDQVEVRNAMGAMSEFVRNYPSSPLRPEAQKILDEVKLRLAEHEMYVADFYTHPNRRRWRAVVTRLSVVEKNYGGVGLDSRVAFGLYDAYLQLDEPDNAKAALQRYIEKNPAAEDVNRARRLIAEAPAQKQIVAPPAEASPDAGT